MYRITSQRLNNGEPCERSVILWEGDSQADGLDRMDEEAMLRDTVIGNGDLLTLINRLSGEVWLSFTLENI